MQRQGFSLRGASRNVVVACAHLMQIEQVLRVVVLGTNDKLRVVPPDTWAALDAFHARWRPPLARWHACGSAVPWRMGAPTASKVTWQHSNRDSSLRIVVHPCSHLRGQVVLGQTEVLVAN